MARIIFLDTNILSKITHPRRHEDAKLWFEGLLRAQEQFRVPEIVDYELRRELIRIGSRRSLERLDDLKVILGYVPITTEAMLKAAELWADARQRGIPTAHGAALDGDVILGAQALTLGIGEEDDVLVATENVSHLERFVTARQWSEIT